MAKYIQRMPEKALSAAQIEEAKKLQLSATDWRWFNAIRKEGSSGVAWGCLPTGTWKRLIVLGLIQGTPFEVWAKGAR